MVEKSAAVVLFALKCPARKIDVVAASEQRGPELVRRPGMIRGLPVSLAGTPLVVINVSLVAPAPSPALRSASTASAPLVMKS